MRFPGTITMPDDAFESTLESAARSFKLHGFRDIVLLGDHGGYQAGPRRRVAARLNREWAATPVRVHALDEYYRAGDGRVSRAALRGARLSRPDEIGTHAGLADTALMLAVDPQLVRAERCAPRTARRRRTASYGDPRRATRRARPGSAST